MASIESIGHPLAFPVEPGGLDLEALPPEDGAMRVRTMARTLAGMQKEAIIQNGPAGNVWRVVCDEGPWLNGTDLAPFPLAFFAAGLDSSFMSEILGEAGDRDLRIDSLSLVQDNFFYHGRIRTKRHHGGWCAAHAGEHFGPGKCRCG